MKAVVFDRTGPPEQVLELRNLPAPKPGKGEVRVRMLASPINPSDLLYIEGKYGLKPKFPATPGFEGVGVVEESGGGLLGRYLRGKRVVAMNDRTGNWAEEAVTSARQCIPVPSDLTDAQAATFFVNPATAIALTGSILTIPQGYYLLQTAAGSALGKMVIRLGISNGFRTINVVRRREQVEELKRLGGDIVLCEADGPIDEQVRSATKSEGVRFAIDPVGGEVGAQVVRSLGPKGKAVFYGLLSGQPVTIDPRFLITGGKSVRGFWLGDWVKAQPFFDKLKLIKKIRKLVRSGVLATEIGGTYPLEKVTDAVREAATPGKTGKVLLTIKSSD